MQVDVSLPELAAGVVFYECTAMAMTSCFPQWLPFSRWESWRLKKYNGQQEPQAIHYGLLIYNTFSVRNDYLVFSYTATTVMPPYEPVGCFNDKKNPRALPEFIKWFTVNKTDLANSLAAIIQKCASKVYEKGLRYFGVEFQHECWTGVNGSLTYNMHGRSNSCLWDHGHGSVWTIFVYRFVEG